VRRREPEGSRVPDPGRQGSSVRDLTTDLLSAACIHNSSLGAMSRRSLSMQCRGSNDIPLPGGHIQMGHAPPVPVGAPAEIRRASLSSATAHGMPCAALCGDTPIEDSTAKPQRTDRLRAAHLHAAA
jgi:hypothetical protein